MHKVKINHKKAFVAVVIAVGMGGSISAGAASLGIVASSITTTLSNVGKLITAASYIAGLAFSIGAIMKFKQHKDNPTQTPIGAPIGLLVVAAALLFMPSLMGMAGSTIFGTASTAGSAGMSFTGS